MIFLDHVVLLNFTAVLESNGTSASLSRYGFNVLSHYNCSGVFIMLVKTSLMKSYLYYRATSSF